MFLFDAYILCEAFLKLSNDFVFFQQVTDILISSRELMELIKNVDAIFHSRNALSGRLALSNLNKFVPQIHEQLQVILWLW